MESTKSDYKTNSVKETRESFLILRFVFGSSYGLALLDGLGSFVSLAVVLDGVGWRCLVYKP